MTVAAPSGIPFLDEEALRAFRDAEPFPNAPKAAIDSRDGLIDFSFGFLFEVASKANDTGAVPRGLAGNNSGPNDAGLAADRSCTRRGSEPVP